MTTDTFPRRDRVASIGGCRSRFPASPRAAHDRAGHGDHAVFCLHRREAATGAAASRARRGVEGSFNATTVDSDTSTSDTVLLFATGQAKHPRCRRWRPMLHDFRAKLFDVLHDLALQVVRDGEGAQKLVRIDVTGAARTNRPSGWRCDRQFAAGENRDRREDANWAASSWRSASRRTGDRDKLSISIGGVWMAARHVLRLRRGAGGGPHEGPGDRDCRRSGIARQGDV